MAEKTEKKTKSERANSFLTKNRKVLLVLLIVALAAIIAYVIFDTVSSSVAEKNIAQIDAISYELTNNSSALSEDEVKVKTADALTKLEALTKKGGISGVRANMLCAELNYNNKDYAAAIENWKAVVAKGKKSYTAPIAQYQLGVCYEQMNDFASAGEYYRAASENSGFPLASHALFSYGRVLETQKNYTSAIEAYQMVLDVFGEDEWAKLAKSRILVLQTSGKAE